MPLAIAPRPALRLTVRFGDFRIGVTLPPGSDAQLAGAWLDPPGLPADAELDVRVGPLSGQTMDWYERLDADGFAFENIRCRVTVASRYERGELIIEELPQSGHAYALLNGMVATAHAEVLRRGGVLLHAATLQHRGRAYVVLGASGAGKSTLAGRFPDTFLHDDYAFLVPERDGQWWFWRHAETRGPRDERPWRVPVAGLFLLGPERSHMAVAPIAPGQAFASVFAHTFHAAGAGAQPTFAGVLRLVHDHPPWLFNHCLAQPPEAILAALEATLHGD